jgi:integral membrane protein (TIGR00529 family)
MIIIKLIVSMILILFISSKTKNIGLSLIIGGSFLLLINNKPILYIVSIFMDTLKEPLTIQLVLAILFISILGYLMDKLGYMNKMVENLENILRSIKLTILLTPAIVGTLLVTGGALMSCPMIDKLGDKIDLPNDKKASVNMIFRHGLYFIFPLSPAMILAINIGGFDSFQFIKLMFPISITVYLVGYFVLLKDVKVEKLPSITINEYFINVIRFLYYTSPIILSVFLVFVFKMIFYKALMMSILLIFVIHIIDVLYNKVKTENILLLIKKGINIKMLIAIFGIMYFKNIVGDLESLNEILISFIDSGFPMELIIFVSAALISYPLASTQPGVAILFPLIMPLANTMELKLLYGMYIYVTSFIFYFISPLHMCQVLTLEYFNVSIKKLYRNYIIIIPSVYFVMILIYIIN